MSWNYRLLAKKNGDNVYFQIHEVYYTDKKPTSYTSNPITIGGENLEEVAWSLKKIKKALKKPILWEGEKFPKKYKAAKT
jgi:hypothetical protein